MYVILADRLANCESEKREIRGKSNDDDDYQSRTLHYSSHSLGRQTERSWRSDGVRDGRKVGEGGNKEK